MLLERGGEKVSVTEWMRGRGGMMETVNERNVKID